MRYAWRIDGCESCLEPRNPAQGPTWNLLRRATKMAGPQGWSSRLSEVVSQAHSSVVESAALASSSASDLASGAASAASRAVAQATASTAEVGSSAAVAASNAAMENLIPTSAASAAAALFGSSDAPVPPKTLALGAAWRDALCPAHRERTDLSGGARSEGLAMIVAACARIESTSTQRRAALQRLVAPLAGWRRPSGALGASLASKARDLKPGADLCH